MSVLILSPPVTTPAEPPSGAFTLAASLAGRGVDAGLMDLSLAFYHRVLGTGDARRRAGRSLEYLTGPGGGYDPERHRSATGELHGVTRGYEAETGWSLTLMDATPPGGVHDPAAVMRALEVFDPFVELFEEEIPPVLDELRPRAVLVSVAYLSQLPAAMSLVSFLRARGVDLVVGGSLLRSLARTGQGLDLVAPYLGRLDLSDGSSLVPGAREGTMLRELAWPRFLSPLSYLSRRPVIPLPLSTGCPWRRCLFCPDRDMPFAAADIDAVARFFDGMPEEVARRRPVVHLLDSAIPPSLLRRFLPISRRHGLGFYGFARPTEALLKNGLMEDAAAAGCLMLQLGVESGSDALLDRFDKGLRREESMSVLEAAAASGIRTYLYLLFGLPGETEDDRRATASLLGECEKSVDFLNLSLFNLPTHCELMDRADEFHIEPGAYPGEESSLHLYRPFTVGGAFPRAEARRFIEGELMKTPAARAARRRTPRWFRAAHLAMMTLPGRREP